MGRNLPLPTPSPLLTVEACEGLLYLAPRETHLIVGTQEYLRRLITEQLIEFETFDWERFSDRRFEPMVEFAAKPNLDGNVQLPPGMRLQIVQGADESYHRVTVFTASILEQLPSIGDSLRQAFPNFPGASEVVVAVDEHRRTKSYPLYNHRWTDTHAAAVAAEFTDRGIDELLILRQTDEILARSEDFGMKSRLEHFAENWRRSRRLPKTPPVRALHVAETAGRDAFYIYDGHRPVEITRR